MTRAEALQRVLGAARVFQGVVEQGGENCGQMVELFLKGCSLGKGYPWCAAVVRRIGHFALYDPKTKTSAWPLPATAGCAVLGEFAAKHQVLLDPAVHPPEPGDVFLLWHTFKDKQGKVVDARFGHTGVVLARNADGSVDTAEGNTNDDGGREGYGFFFKTRSLKPKDRLVRWATLLPE